MARHAARARAHAKHGHKAKKAKKAKAVKTQHGKGWVIR